jgi:hypothetical protein
MFRPPDLRGKEEGMVVKRYKVKPPPEPEAA